ncbi:hypothetical protein SJAG_00146 [Schizosaccharomyces japonicus yFS275]|uniref:Uncharacterized protein n=1 Tax=Schizosaccharomyces japonicus (strain yFS275 / FY16936) TaxID=402676 RepID=B6JXK4_SCHJY|nr:hypothetical protein SJAG_00146 [Schizosaccharomyces japonicus yFS275]EEB05148.1 hypothetical protein SJAG_00146 [Schizosaccharomyces japonicus yFS275]
MSYKKNREHDPLAQSIGKPTPFDARGNPRVTFSTPSRKPSKRIILPSSEPVYELWQLRETVGNLDGAGEEPKMEEKSRKIALSRMYAHPKPTPEQQELIMQVLSYRVSQLDALNWNAVEPTE